MKIKTTIIAISLGLILGPAISTAQTSSTAQADQVVLAMAAAFKKNDSRALSRLLPGAKSSPLEPWAAYWEIKLRLPEADQSQIDRFMRRYPNTYVADRLRADWLLLLGSRRDWAALANNYPSYRMRDDKDIRCYVEREDARVIEQLWMSQKEVATGCGAVAGSLIDTGKMDPIVQWRKSYKGQAPAIANWERLTSAQKNWAWGFAGRALAQKLDLEALTAFAKVTEAKDLSSDMLEWWTRAALRRKDWSLVSKLIDAMPAETQKEWLAWREIAQQPAANKAPSLANLLLTGANATQGPSVPANIDVALPGLQRAIYAIRNGLRADGVKEWNFEVNLARGSMSDAERIAAADLACRSEVWDRCINTSERTQGVIDWQQRYPTPYKPDILAAAKEFDLDPAFVFGLIRQESRFIADIQSHVGAAGLMQLMPATARWTAKRIGMSDFSPDQVQSVPVNTRLGTAYLRYVLDEFGGNTALAAAAYNAGPQRVKQWRAAMAGDTGVSTPLDLAIWSENIPFLETRDYVKKVLANSAIYSKLLK